MLGRRSHLFGRWLFWLEEGVCASVCGVCKAVFVKYNKWELKRNQIGNVLNPSNLKYLTLMTTDKFTQYLAMLHVNKYLYV